MTEPVPDVSQPESPSLRDVFAAFTPAGTDPDVLMDALKGSRMPPVPLSALAAANKAAEGMAWCRACSRPEPAGMVCPDRARADAKLMANARREPPPSVPRLPPPPVAPDAIPPPPAPPWSPGRAEAMADNAPANETLNELGQWVPSIPLPFYGIRKKCFCGRKFWTVEGYRGHYALAHLMHLARARIMHVPLEDSGG